MRLTMLMAFLVLGTLSSCGRDSETVVQPASVHVVGGAEGARLLDEVDGAPAVIGSTQDAQVVFLIDPALPTGDPPEGLLPRKVEGCNEADGRCCVSEDKLLLFTSFGWADSGFGCEARLATDPAASRQVLPDDLSQLLVSLEPKSQDVVWSRSIERTVVPRQLSAQSGSEDPCPSPPRSCRDSQATSDMICRRRSPHYWYHKLECPGEEFGWYRDPSGRTCDCR